jgi:signal transduction histidine kinase
MASSFHPEAGPRSPGAGAGKVGRGERMRRLGQRAMRLGAADGLPVDTHKRIRLCNINALGGSLIMAAWTAFELLFGQRTNALWEAGFLLGFLAVLAFNARCAHRTARLLLIVTANACVFAGALLFTEPSGGILPFFAMAAMPLLLFGPHEWPLAALGAAISAVLLAACKTGFAARVLAIHPRTAPGWYFAANAATTFALAFLVPFLFFRWNLRAEASLRRMGREKLKRVIDADLIGVVRGRLSGHVEDANDTFLSLLGYTRDDLKAGALDLGVIVPIDLFQSRPPSQGATSVFERTCPRKDGTMVPTLIGVARLEQDNDEVIGFVLDLSAQKHLEAQRAMLNESREALRLRDLFNSIASHELKTPLTALMLNLRLLRGRLVRETRPDSTLRVQVDRCETAARRMADLIHALLDVAQIHRGRFTLNRRDTEVVEAVRNVVSGFEVNRQGAGQRIAVRADGPFTARLDPLRFDQVVTNLLSNAVKYGAGKPIEIRVQHDRAADAAHLEVLDGGPGIDPGMTEKIFEPFQRATSMEPIPGMGLGLYVVKMIVEGHGGHIAVDTRLGCGSRFIVDLPCVEAQPSVPRAERPIAAQM